MITPEVATPQAVFWDVPALVKLDELGIFASAEFWMLQSRLGVYIATRICSSSWEPVCGKIIILLLRDILWCVITVTW